MEKINTIDLAGNVDSQLAEIQQDFTNDFHKSLAPCWDTLTAKAVRQALVEAFERVEKIHNNATAECPVCQNSELFTRTNRLHGCIVYQCSNCRADFIDPVAEAQPRTLPLAALPQPKTSERKFITETIQQIPPNHSVLFIETGNDDWDSNWDFATIFNATRVSWQDTPSLEEHQFDAIIALGTPEVIRAPYDFFHNIIRRHGRRGTLFIFMTGNRQCPVQSIKEGRQNPDGPRWRSETHQKFIERLGLSMVWHGGTQLDWRSVQESLGFMPPLQIKPHNQEGLTVQLAGEELDGVVQSYFSPLLGRLSGHGRFLLSITSIIADRMGNHVGTK